MLLTMLIAVELFCSVPVGSRFIATNTNSNKKLTETKKPPLYGGFQIT